MHWIPPVYDQTVELRDHLTIPQWRIAILDICSRHGLDGGTLEPASSGSDVVWFAGDCVVKLTAPYWSEEINAEAHWLTRVHGQLGVETPEVLAKGDLEGWPYVVTRRVPGMSLGLVWPELTRSNRLRLAAEIGQMTRDLHDLAVDGEDDDWAPFWTECCSNVVDRHYHDDVPRELVDSIPRFLEAAGVLESTTRVLLHTEILDEHVLVSERNGRLEPSALIDFADGRIGPPEYDFAAPVEFIFRGERGLLRAFLEAYGDANGDLTSERCERMLAWGLLHRFGRLRRMLRAVAPWTPTTLPELARRLYC